jgi:myo-inositol-1(or 4)-monophosphatase
MTDAAALLDVAVDAACAAGAILVERFRMGPEGLATKSSPTDPVSEADRAAERAIRAVLAARRPDDAVLGEEGEDVAGTSGLRWVVDPLDGTVNYLYGLPQWSVSVACEGHAAAIFDPTRDELFTVVEGDAARLGGQPLAGSGCEDVGTALVATGFGYDTGVRARQAAVIARLLPVVRDIRRTGSAALDLAYTAAGRHDAYFERGVQAWDTAAGIMLCRAAGLTVRELPAAGGLAAGVLVAAPAIAGELEALIG